jgi:branched-chain amino acid transport system ATP-binding protein
LLPVLKVVDLNAFYGTVQALREVSLEVVEGTIVTLIGANGAGKSTLLKTISGLVTASGGEIWFEGKRIERLHPHEIVKLGIVQCPENRHIWPQMSVLENLLMGAYIFDDQKEVMRLLEEMYAQFPILFERREQLAGSLSGGEQQMLAIARALMARPRLLLLDEPSLGLAPIVVEQVAEIVRRIHSLGTTIILVEQNAFLALNLASKAYVLETGKIVLSGTGSELLSNSHVKKSYLGI